MNELDDETRIKLAGLRAISDELLQQQDTLRRTIARIVGIDSNEEGSGAADFVYDRKVTVEQLWNVTAPERERLV